MCPVIQVFGRGETGRSKESLRSDGCRKRSVLLALLLIGMAWATPCAAKQYRYDNWQAGTGGLPQNVLRGLTQTPDGYLWVATLDGIARFDGVRFTTFNKSNTPEIASNRFSAMVRGQDGDFWLGGESLNLTRYHHGTFHTYTPEEGVPAASVDAMTGDKDGNLWILSENSILRWNNKSSQLVDVTPGNLHVRYSHLQWDNAGFWRQDKAGLHIFSQGRMTDYPLPGWLNAGHLWQVALDENSDVWIELTDGVQAMIPAGKQAVERTDPAHPAHLTFKDEHGHVWGFHVGRRLSRYLDFVSSGQPTSIPMNLFLEDREGNIWVGTEGSGLYRLQEQSIVTYSKAQGLGDKNVYPILQDHTGAIWLGAWESGLNRYSDGKFTDYSVGQGLSSLLVTALAEDRKGRLWVGTHGGLMVFQNGRFSTIPGLMLPDRTIAQAILQDSGGTMWIGTTNGIVLYRDGPSKTITMADGLATNDVRVILQSRNGDIWIGGYGGLTRVHGGQFTRWTESDGLPSGNIRALHEDRDGVLWIGTYDGGLGRLKNGEFTRYTESNGLFNNGVFQILEDDRGNFWMSCNRGIYRVSKQELNAFADGKLASITSVAYGKTDGMVNVECNGGLWPAGIRTHDGKLWFPTQDGVAVIDPQLVHINPRVPPVLIESALVDRAPVRLNDGLRIPPGSQNVEIEYTALSFVHPEQIRFQYKLEGLDSNWIDAGARRTAYFSHLPPGKYRFHVVARNSDGVWNEGGQVLPITVIAPFYMTWWFTLLEAAVAGGLILLAVRYRLAQMQRMQAMQKAFSQQLIASQESERQRIAAELHDSLGQRLVVINNLALFALRAKNKSALSAEDSSAMQEISTETSQAIQETREISYNLRPFQLDRLGLTKAIEGLVRTVSSASGTRITAEVDNIDDAFAEDLRINFYRIVQESLNNMMKHAHATEAEVRIVRDRNHLSLTIRDNGVGFSAASRPAKTGKSGFGLTGMAERANSLGGTFRTTSTPGQGTVVTVDIALGGRVNA